ncbi:MAG: hypothetical protein V7605_900 [Acidimicrobiaceae bacterium]|jgi:divalent metal cation (Fe/Co/Zn/Cd) transporter
MRLPRPGDDPVAVAIAASWVTIVWSASTGSASAVVGILAGSLALAGLGFTVLIDVGSSLVLVWRFNRQRDGAGGVERAEEVAHRVASGALVALGVVLAVEAVRSLIAHAEPDTTVASVVLAAAALVFLPVLARWKYRAAHAVGSRALRADAHITALGAAIGGVTLAGLVVVSVWDWWWADAAAALILAAVAEGQGVRGLRS